MTSVSGDTYSTNAPVENVFSLAEVETWAPVANYWLLPNSSPGSFVLNLGCLQDFSQIILVNTHNAQYRNRNTKKFR